MLWAQRPGLQGSTLCLQHLVRFADRIFRRALEKRGQKCMKNKYELHGSQRKCSVRAYQLRRRSSGARASQISWSVSHAGCIAFPENVTTLGRKALLDGAHRSGVFSDEKLRASLNSGTRVVKEYPGVSLLLPEHRALVEDYAWHRTRPRQCALLTLTLVSFQCVEDTGKVENFSDAQVTRSGTSCPHSP